MELLKYVLILLRALKDLSEVLFIEREREMEIRNPRKGGR